MDEIAGFELGGEVEARLRALILGGELTPGERLVETALATRFGTSRGPIREALSRLEASGLVVTRPRRGSFVASLSANDVEELYTLRSAMELLAVERAATRVTAQDIAEMEKALTELGRALTADDARRTGEADIRFHRAIVRAADHRRLHEAWEVYADQTLLLMQELSHSHPEVQAPSGWHGKILRALAERDSATAVQLLREHLAAAYQGMLEQFSEAGRISP